MQGKHARACKDAKKSKKSKNFSAFRPAERLFLHNLPRPAQARPCNCSRAGCKCPSAPAHTPPVQARLPHFPARRISHELGFPKKMGKRLSFAALLHFATLFKQRRRKGGSFRLERKRAIEDAQKTADAAGKFFFIRGISPFQYPHFIYTPQADSMESGITPARGKQTAANHAFRRRKRLRKTPVPPFLH